MEFEELKSKTKTKALVRGESSTGKTRNCCIIALKVLSEGFSVRYMDLESEGRDTLVGLAENGEFDKEVVSGLDYVSVDGYEDFSSGISDAEKFDLLVIDPLDHKHTMVLKEVTDASSKADADWQEYPRIYSGEKQIMEDISNMDTNVLCSLDPDSGKTDKPKGVQANVQGYFSIVVDLYRSGDDWQHKVFNWVGRSDLIGGEIENVELPDALTKEILERVQ